MRLKPLIAEKSKMKGSEKSRQSLLDVKMNIDIDNLVSISEANQNFSKVARMVDEKGTALILKNNAPRYVLLDYNLFRQNTIADDADIDTAAKRLLHKHIKAFEELAK